MSGLKLKHHRGDNSTVSSSWFLQPSGWSSAQLCRIFIGIPLKPSKPPFLPIRVIQRVHPSLSSTLWNALFHELIFFFWLLLLLTCGRVSCPTDWHVYCWDCLLMWLSTGVKNLTDVPVKHLNLTCAWNRQEKYPKMSIFLKYKTQMETPA